MARCERTDCGIGTIDRHGFCDHCGLRPLGRSTSVPVESPARPAVEPPAPRDPPGGAPEPVEQIPPAPWWGLDLVDGDHRHPLTQPPPGTDRPDDEQDEAEELRFCASTSCRAPIGRGHDGRADRLSGHCPDCGTPFDFTGLEGRVLPDRYVVKRMLGKGGFGRAYLCHDRNLNTDVVLKVLPETVDRTARRECNALVGLRHDSIVRILSYEPEGSYLVLEHIPGHHFSARQGEPLEILLAHGLRILQALDYLHARQLLHCDVKPSNIIRFAEEGPTGALDRVRLIDFGSVRSMKDDQPLVEYTDGFAPPLHLGGAGELDPEHRQPTAGLDLFCLGRTLEKVCEDHLRGNPQDLRVDSLKRLLARSTEAANPARRFTSARQFAEQLSGVIRQVVAASPRRLRISRTSVLFGPVLDPLHGGLGAARPLSHWIAARVTPEGVCTLPEPFVCPGPLAAVTALPAPQLAPYEQHHRDIAGQKRGELDNCRAALRQGMTDKARSHLDRVGLPAWDWLGCWYGGLIELVGKEPGTAAERFEEVRNMLPGELVPLFALGLCAEQRGDLDQARRYYEAVTETAPGLGAASFGLARVHLREGRRPQAVAMAEQLARQFRYEGHARIAAVRLRVALATMGKPDGLDPADVERAEEEIEGLVGDEVMLGVRAEIEFARHALSGRPEGLEEAVRKLAPLASTEREHTALVDLANRLRPPIRWRWSRSMTKRRRMT